MKTVQAILALLEGLKTYLCAAAVVLTGAAFKEGLIDMQTFLAMVAVFLGLMGASTRSAIGKGK